MLGMRPNGIYPTEHRKTAILRDRLCSPRDGRVVRALDKLPDNPPGFRTELTIIVGNHVAVECQDVNILMAHMISCRMVVRSGDSGTSGQLVVQVGNSGSTSEPHLYIRAERTGDEDGPMLFNGRFLTRNSVITVRE